MDCAYQIFGYLKKYKNHCIVINCKDPICVGRKDALNLDVQLYLKINAQMLQKKLMPRFQSHKFMS